MDRFSQGRRLVASIREPRATINKTASDALIWINGLVLANGSSAVLTCHHTLLTVLPSPIPYDRRCSKRALAAHDTKRNVMAARLRASGPARGSGGASK